MVADHQAHAHHWSIVWNTPLKRRLAREGCNFASARTVQPICSPARASMLTGLYPHAHGVTENDGRFGGGIDEEPRMHGRSLMELMGEPGAAWRSGFMAQHYGLHEPVPQRAWYAGDWKLVVQEDGFVELYDLDDDPHEMRNLASDEEHRNTLESLWAGLRDAMTETGDLDRRLSTVPSGSPGR